MTYLFYNQDCISGAQEHLADNSVDLIITDPPYGISGDKLDKHYNRNESFVIDGYVEIPQAEYAEFSMKWIKQAERVLKPGGALYVVSGYTNLIDILNALRETSLKEVNHIIWKYNFGVYTKTKYISSHYHILYYVKPKAKHTFNTFARYADHERSDKGGSANHEDREDVWMINREYKPGQVKNKNELPTALLTKMIQYSSQEGDMVCDFFLGSFSTAKVAKGLNRKAVGFEISQNAFDHQLQEINALEVGYLQDTIRRPPENQYFNQGKPIEDDERAAIAKDFQALIDKGSTKKKAIDALSQQYGRGYWSILRVVDGTTNKSANPNKNDSPNNSTNQGDLF